jgi:hypothetical protein
MRSRYLVYLRAGAPDATVLARAAGLARADAERVIRSRVPLPVAVCDSVEAARDAVLRLREAGTDGFVITPEALRRFVPRPLARAERTSLGLRVYGPFDEVDLQPGDLRMLVFGRIRQEVRLEAELGGSFASSSAAGESLFLCLFRTAAETHVLL